MIAIPPQPTTSQSGYLSFGTLRERKKKMNKSQTIIGTAVGLVFMVAGGFIFPIGYQELKNAQDSLDWPTTYGVIILSEVKEIKDEGSTTFSANVRYKYSIGEKPYSSDQVSFGQYSSSDSEYAWSIIHRYSTGQKVKVYFNPADPNKSVLEPGVSWVSYMPLGISTAVFAFGAIEAIFFGIVAPKQRRRRTEAFRQTASTLAFTFCESDKTLQQQDFFQLPLFKQGTSREIRNILRKHSADGEAIIFDYEFEQASGDSSIQYHQTVAAFWVPNRNLPEFCLRPENIFDKIGELFGRQDIDFDLTPQFSKCYRLQGQSEPAIRAAFNFNVLQFFSQNPGWCLEGKGKWLVIYQINKQVKPEELSVFLQQRNQISQLFS